jgi:hypothetical protein
VTEDGGGIASTFACFPFAIKDSAATNLFALMLILSTATLDAVTVTATVTAVFDMTTPEGVAALEGALVLGTMPALDACIVWVALVGTDFEGVVLMPFGDIDTFAGITFRPGTFTHFLEGLAPMSLFLFFAASSHASNQVTG